MHLIKLPAPGDRVRDAVEVALFVDGWPERAPLAHPDTEPIHKNWLPFVHFGELFLEYAIEPRVVLRVDAHTGRCVLVGVANEAPDDAADSCTDPPAAAKRAEGLDGGAFASFPPLARLTATYGRVSGGAPPVHVPAHRAYIGLAHVKASKDQPHLLGTSQMRYRHLFYAFDDTPPFAVRAAGTPFVLPEPPTERGGRAGTPTVQFAAGMVLTSEGEELLISYSVRDCGARVARVRLDEVLRDVGLAW